MSNLNTYLNDLMIGHIALNIDSTDDARALLNELTSDLSIYDSKKDAKAKGFEAHHIIPLAIQIRDYDNNNCTDYFHLGRQAFEKDIKFDDRCFRLTYCEHLFIHYLLAIIDPYIMSKAFYCMTNYSIKKITIDEKELIKSLEKYDELRAAGIKSISEKQKGKYVSDETRSKISKSLRAIDPSKRKRGPEHHLYGRSPVNKGIPATPEQKEKNRLAHLGKHTSEKTKELLRITSTGKYHKEETIKRMSESRMGDKNPMFGVKPSEETNKKRSDAIKKTKKEISDAWTEYKTSGYKDAPTEMTWNQFTKWYSLNVKGSKRIQYKIINRQRYREKLEKEESKEKTQD